MAGLDHQYLQTDPLALLGDWTDSGAVERWQLQGGPLVTLEEALESSLLQQNISREQLLRRLAQKLHHPRWLPLLWCLPQRWRLQPAQLPAKLRTLAGVLETGLLSPLLLACLGDSMAQLLPAQPAQATRALETWSSSAVTWAGQQQPLPRQLQLLLQARAATAEEVHPNKQGDTGPPGSGEPLVWHNVGLRYSQTDDERLRNALMAQVLNRLGANLGLDPGLSGAVDRSDPWTIEGQSSGRAWLEWLQQRGWSVVGRLRASVASFGFGASLRRGDGLWAQVPVGLPMRTGLLDSNQNERLLLLPHSSIELELRRDDTCLLLQFFQGSEGLCGWAALNDLHRPWQNDRHNGSVRYIGTPYVGDELLELLDLTEVMAWVHNHAALHFDLPVGGYGSLGFCLDSAALLHYGMRQESELFPLLLTGLWREHLEHVLNHLPSSSSHALARQRYAGALAALPLDLSTHGSERRSTLDRIRRCQPTASPFAVLAQLRSD